MQKYLLYVHFAMSVCIKHLFYPFELLPDGGGGGIRTPGGYYTTAVFETDALNHSATPPNWWIDARLDYHHYLITVTSTVQTTLPHFRQENLHLLLDSFESGFKIERRAVESNHKVLPSHDLAGRFLPGRIYSPINSFLLKLQGSFLNEFFSVKTY